ncbi:MAG: hypothetical protein AAF571_13205 [Verrucomicrobiota bacterium]
MTRKNKITISVLLLAAVIAIIIAILMGEGEEKQSPSSALPEKVLPEQVQQNVNTTSDVEIPQDVEEAIDALEIPEQEKKGLKLLSAIYGNPFEFYGKVVDENDTPIPNARISYSMLQGHFESGKKGKTTSREDGTFTIQGKGGAVLIGVGKDGYYPMDNYSSAGFSTTMVPTPELLERTKPPYGGGYDKPLPPKDDPAIFVLRKKGEAAELIRTQNRFEMSNAGNPVGFSMETGKKVSPASANIQFEHWGDKAEKDATGNYDWRFRITVPGGGLIEREGQFDFEAPENGYDQSVEINMPTSLGEDWKNSVNRNYFVRLADGNYGRMQLRIYGGRRFNLTIQESLVNPSGSRNLEYDPALAVKP